MDQTRLLPKNDNRIPGLKRRRDDVDKDLTKFPPHSTPHDSDEEGSSGSDGSVLNNDDTSSIEESLGRLWKKQKLDSPTSVHSPETMNKPYACAYEGCPKAYTKPSRLQEHMRSHTGERPYKCGFNGCGKSYLRESHLQAHTRSHLPSSSRPFLCPYLGCDKRFWTNSQLRIHEGTHDGTKRHFKCQESDCNESFSKHNQLQAHFAQVHCPAGTKPFRCDHEGCTKSFTSTQKLRAHIKTHQLDRYMCSAEECQSQYFQTWTLFQAHIRTVHPPTCPFNSCRAKSFSSQKNLKVHLRLHEQRGDESALMDRMGGTGSSDDEHQGPATEIGRDWHCDWEGCTKSFKSKNALTVHTSVNHLQQRRFICSRDACGKTFGYKHLLQRHLAKCHSTRPSANNVLNTPDDGGMDVESSSFIELLTGEAYKKRKEGDKAGSNATHRILHCPWPRLLANLPEINKVDNGNDNDRTISTTPKCEAMYNRAYDLRRHLRADHGLDIEKGELEVWLGLQPTGTQSIPDPLV